MKLISVKMPEALIEAMDELVRRGVYPSRSAILRAAVRDLLREELWRCPEFREEDEGIQPAAASHDGLRQGARAP